VKKKPSGGDISQLIALANRPEKVKKYIYLEEPTEDFAAGMRQYTDKVDFWDGEKLTVEIVSLVALISE